MLSGTRLSFLLGASFLLSIIHISFVEAVPYGDILESIKARSVAQSDRFDLSAPSADFFRDKALQDVTVMQGFAFDQKNKRLFVVQRKNGAAETSGDLAVTQLDFSGNKVGYMYLIGFGHGVSIAAEGVGTDTYLWTEVDASSNGYGQQLARFKFTNAKTISRDTTGLSKFKPSTNMGSMTPSIDPLGPNLVVRYDNKAAGGQYVTAYVLSAAARGDFSTPLYNFKQPVLINSSTNKAKTFQGYAVYGSYFYMMTGDSKDVSSTINSEVTSVDVNTGSIRQGPLLTKAGESLSFREPEGMAVYTDAGQPHLYLGFASGVSGSRRSNLFYKSEITYTSVAT